MDERFQEIHQISLAELNAIIATSKQPLAHQHVHQPLIRNLPVDLRITLSWNADNTDIDLHVTDSNKETASFRNTLTYQGGRMSADVTQEYGPEELILKNAKPGKYTVHTHYFGDSRQIVGGTVPTNPFWYLTSITEAYYGSS